MTTVSVQTYQVISQFLDYLWLEKGTSQNTLSAYRNDLQYFASWLVPELLLAVSTEQIQAYLQHRLNNGYNKRSLICIPSFFSLCVVVTTERG